MTTILKHDITTASVRHDIRRAPEVADRIASLFQTFGGAGGLSDVVSDRLDGLLSDPQACWRLAGLTLDLGFTSTGSIPCYLASGAAVLLGGEEDSVAVSLPFDSLPDAMRHDVLDLQIALVTNSVADDIEFAADLAEAELMHRGLTRHLLCRDLDILFSPGAWSHISGSAARIKDASIASASSRQTAALFGIFILPDANSAHEAINQSRSIAAGAGLLRSLVGTHPNLGTVLPPIVEPREPHS